MRLEGKVAIVTASAGAGIGQAIIRKYAEEGASVVVTDIHEKRVNGIVEDLKGHGKKAIGVLCDVSVWDQVENLVKQTLDAFGRIDILVNNAAREVIAPIIETTEENWDLIMDVGLKGTFFCTKAVLPTMMNQKSGSIVNMSSVDGYVGNPMGECAYCASKAGIMAFTRSTAAEGAPYNIRANAIAPGFIPNPFLRKVYTPEMLEMMESISVLKRGGKPEEIANIATFLVSDEASYVTGIVLNASAGGYWSQ